MRRAVLLVLICIAVLLVTPCEVLTWTIRGRVRNVPVKGMVTVMVYPEDYTMTPLDVPEERPINMFGEEPVAFEALSVYGDAFMAANGEGLSYEIVDVPSGRYTIWAGQFVRGMMCPWMYGAYRSVLCGKYRPTAGRGNVPVLCPEPVDVFADAENIDIALSEKLLPGHDTMSGVYSPPYWYLVMGIPMPSPDPATAVILGEVHSNGKGVILVEATTEDSEWLSYLYLSRSGTFVLLGPPSFIRVRMVEAVQKDWHRKRGEINASWTRISWEPWKGVLRVHEVRFLLNPAPQSLDKQGNWGELKKHYKTKE